jgi:regulator of sigma E protease
MAVLSSPLAIVLAILSLGVLIIIHEGGHFLAARLSGMRVERFSIGFGPTLLSFTRGGTIFQIAAIPLGGYVQIAGLNPDEAEGADGVEPMAPDDPRLYRNRPVWQRLATIFAGPATNYLFAMVAFLFVFGIWGIPVEGTRPIVGSVQVGKPASLAGLEPGDEIKKIDELDITESAQVSATIGKSGGKEVRLELVRDGRPLTIRVTPQRDGERYLIGIAMAHKEEWIKPGLGEQLTAAITFPFEKSAHVLSFLGQVVTGRQEAKFSGPVGIVKEMKKQIVLGAKYAVHVAGLISVFLGLFNLLPLPALDGGRLVFLLWELISRRRVNERIEQTIHTVGMVALIGFMIYVTIRNDSGLFH